MSQNRENAHHSTRVSGAYDGSARPSLKHVLRRAVQKHPEGLSVARAAKFLILATAPSLPLKHVPRYGLGGSWCPRGPTNSGSCDPFFFLCLSFFAFSCSTVGRNGTSVPGNLACSSADMGFTK